MHLEYEHLQRDLCPAKSERAPHDLEELTEL